MNRTFKTQDLNQCPRSSHCISGSQNPFHSELSRWNTPLLPGGPLGLNLFLNGHKQNIPIPVCTSFPHHSVPWTCHQDKGRFLPSQPSAPICPCSLLSGDLSDLCRPSVTMPQALGCISICAAEARTQALGNRVHTFQGSNRSPLKMGGMQRN